MLNIRKIQPVEVKIHLPTTTEGIHELSCRVASMHADAVDYILKSLPCPTSQKLDVLDAVIGLVKKGNKEQV